MGHSRYTLDATPTSAFAAECYPSYRQGNTHLQIATDSSIVYLFLTESQLERIHAAIQQRITQITARRMNEAQAANAGCVCPEYAGEVDCPIHGTRVA